MLAQSKGKRSGRVRTSDHDCSNILCSGKEGLRSIAPNVRCPVTEPLMATEDSSWWPFRATEPHAIRQLSLTTAPLASEILTQTMSCPRLHHRRCLSPQWTIMELKGDRQRTSASVYALYLTYPGTLENKSYIAATSRW